MFGHSGRLLPHYLIPTSEIGNHRSTLYKHIAVTHAYIIFFTDVVDFLKDFSSELTNTFSEVTLENVFSTHNLEFEYMNNQYDMMMRDACLLCQHSKSNICKQLLFNKTATPPKTPKTPQCTTTTTLDHTLVQKIRIC